MVEDQRIIIAAYEIGAAEQTDDWGYEVSASKRTQIRVRDLKRAPKFWNFYQNSSGPPAWRSGLFRYVSDDQAKKMYRAVQKASIAVSSFGGGKKAAENARVMRQQGTGAKK